MGLTRFLPSRSRKATQTPINLDEDEVYRILSTPRRRHVISILSERDEDAIALKELARVIATTETGIGGADEDVYNAVYTSLYQVHLPKLDDTGVIDWDTEEGTVRRGHSIPGLVAIIYAVLEGAQPSD